MTSHNMSTIHQASAPRPPGHKRWRLRGECSTALSAQLSQSPAPAVRERAADLMSAHVAGTALGWNWWVLAGGRERW